VRSAPSHGHSSGERCAVKCVWWAASPWSSKTGVYEDRLEEGETAAAMPSRQVVAAIAPATPTRYRATAVSPCEPPPRRARVWSETPKVCGEESTRRIEPSVENKLQTLPKRRAATGPLKGYRIRKHKHETATRYSRHFLHTGHATRCSTQRSTQDHRPHTETDRHTDMEHTHTLYGLTDLRHSLRQKYSSRVLCFI